MSTAADECFAPPDARERTIELATEDWRRAGPVGLERTIAFVE